MHAFYVRFTVVLILEKNEDIKTKSRTWEDISQCHKSFFCPIGPLQHEKISRVTESTLSLKQLTADKVKYIEEKKKRKKLHRFVYVMGLCFLQRLVAPNIYFFDRIFWFEFIKVLLMYNAIMAITIFSSICWRSIKFCSQNSISRYYLGIFWVCRQYIQ